MTENEESVVRRSTLMAAGHSNYSVALRCRPDGPWQQLLPGVLLLKSGPPTRRQRLKAAVLYAGQDAVITGIESLRSQGLYTFDTDEVHILVPASRRLSSREYVQVERTSRMPRPRLVKGLAVAPPHRATIDAARRIRDPSERRALLFAPIEAGLCTIEQLRAEIDAGAQRGTALLRELMNEILAPPLTSTVQQSWAKRVIKEAPLPPPEWDVPVHTAAGQAIGIADAWWDSVGLAWDFGNQRDRSIRRREEAFTNAGLHFVRTTVAELRSNVDAVVLALARAYLNAANRPRPPVQALT
ncbi:hypothetical protein LWC34_36355 [Kibdelosporangium philippinense]|uniref:DUF559 domain-containing protein n=1 Tax=Kibdelosporangium philippinense TaxID=211113 RepID=A0ABS8ZKD2_9PSEU|nr:hypothetical protein [Kibdelosporangium philippinense]MCE7008249.1 hypothetical protein [Kibdelosporangium philippinense]